MLSTHGYFDPVPRLGQTDTGGQVVYVLELAKAFTEMGVKVDIYTRWFDRKKQQVEMVPGFPDVRVIRIPAGPWEFIPKEVIYPILPELAGNMVKFIHDEGIEYDLLHGHYVDAGIVSLSVAEALKKPVFFTAHSLGAWKREQMGGDPEIMEKKYNFNFRISEESRIFHSVAGQTVTSTVQLDKIHQLYDNRLENIAVIATGVNIHLYRHHENGDKVPVELPARYIYSLSRIDPNKGYDYLIHAFAKVHEKHHEIYLVIGGGSPDPKPTELEIHHMIEALTRQYGLEDRVRLIGYVKDEMMVPYYQNAMMFVLPSRFEPMGMTAQEAMACGLPVVASKHGGIRTVITHKENGLLIDPANTKQFADSMIGLIENEEMSASIGAKASKLIREQYSWEVIAEHHLDFYQHLFKF